MISDSSLLGKTCRQIFSRSVRFPCVPAILACAVLSDIQKITDAGLRGFLYIETAKPCIVVFDSLSAYLAEHIDGIAR